jgi:hypothetical protein
MLEVISGSHFVADLTLGYGEVVFDYLARRNDGLGAIVARCVAVPA